MIRRELGIWRRLNHVNIVPFLGIGYGFGMLGSMSLVSLWMLSGSLHDFLEKYHNNHNFGVGHRLQFVRTLHANTFYAFSLRADSCSMLQMDYTIVGYCYHYHRLKIITHDSAFFSNTNHSW